MMASKKEPAKEAEQKFVLRLPESLHRSLRHVAIDRGTSLNALISVVLDEWWARQPEHGSYAGSARQPKKKGASNVV